MSDSVHIEVYKEAEKYILRELTLINNRLTWILTIHGFLYATYGFTIQKQLETFRGLRDQNVAPASIFPLCSVLTQSELFLFTIASVGIAISSMGLISIRAACRAMAAVAENFVRANSEYFQNAIINDVNFYKTVDKNYYLPDMLGGGQQKLNGRGNSASVLIPLALLLSWIFSIGVSYYVYTDNPKSFCSIIEKEKP